jgi:hypothetical protein
MVAKDFKKIRDFFFQQSFLHLHVDLWTSKVTSDKFIGIKVWYVNSDFEFCSRTLGVRLLNPSRDLLIDDEGAKTKLSALIFN